MTTTVRPPVDGPALRSETPRTVRIGGREIGVVLPNLHDPRLHLATVTVTLFVLGIGWLGFRLSIPQIVLTVITCAAIEVVWMYRRTSLLVWPASAMQTATSVALLMRVVGTENGDHWSFEGWYFFVAVGAFSLLTKYVIRFPGGAHVFNPSNIGLVVAFLVLGSDRVEPLDFWWEPFGPAMALAYAVIFAGGFWICGRLRLLGMSLALWLSLAAGIAVLAATGHTITTRWSFTPISGWHFWWIVMTSPEIFIFLFFMITDPKTVPSGRIARVVFGGVLGVVCALLMAPWDTEFGAKVGLLGGLAVMCAARPLLPNSSREAVRTYRFSRSVGIGVVGVAGLVGVAIAVAGLPARGAPDPAPASAAGSVAEIDPASLPVVSIDPEVAGLSADLATPEGAQELAATLAWNLQVEAEALVNGDASLLTAVDHGQRLEDLEAEVAAGLESGERVVPTYEFDSLHLLVVFPGGFQSGPNAGLVGEGTMTEVVHDANGGQVARPDRPFATTFSLRQMTDGRWLTTDTLPAEVRDG
jgi:hypothetical protein